MRLIGLWTSSHHEMKSNWFDPSLGKEFQPHLVHFKEEDGGDYLSPSWTRSVLAKNELILSKLESDKDEVFVYSDCDIQFFGLTPKMLLAELGGYDIAFQRDDYRGLACSGFFVARSSSQLAQVWKAVIQQISHQGRDQIALNKLLHETPALRWRLLSTRFFGAGCGLPLLPIYQRIVRLKFRSRAPLWVPGMPLAVPNEIVMHHANWTVGITNKICQLEYVKSKRLGELQA